MILHPSLTSKPSFEHKSQASKQEKLIPPKGQIGHLLLWRDQLSSPSSEPIPNSYKTISTKTIEQSNLEDFGTNIQALYLNIDWSTFSMERFAKLMISDNLMNNGMVFVWAQKELMDEVMTHLEQFEINYVEIFTVALLSLQKILALDAVKPKGTLLNFFQSKTPAKSKEIGDYLKMKAHEFPALKANQVMLTTNSEQMFQKSKKNLLLLRKFKKNESLELRHQRTSDVFFGLYDEQKREVDQKVEECVYNMIETLLIKANYVPGESLKMMELWAKPGAKREGWISVSQTQ